MSLLPRDSIYMYSIYVFREIHERALGGFSGGRRLVSRFSRVSSVVIIYVPQTGQRLYCLQCKLNIDKAPAFTPDFIVLTNMFSLQNNLDLIIHQKCERPLSFSLSPASVRDHRVLLLTKHAVHRLVLHDPKANSARWDLTRARGATPDPR